MGLDAAGLTFGPVGTVEEIVSDPQAFAIGALRPLGGTGMMTIDSPFTLTGVDKVPAVPAPGFGEHTGSVLRGAGYSDSDIAALREGGIVAGP